ncbi:hypothetical protein [Nocardia sp. NPDC059228]
MIRIDTGRHCIIATNDGQPGGLTSIVLGKRSAEGFGAQPE